MTGLHTLARPLAQRVAALPQPDAAPYTEPDIPASVIAAAGEALDRGETHYTDRPGIPELRGLVVERLNARYGLTYTPADITITCGATEARFCAVNILAGAGGVIVCPGDPAPIAITAQLLGTRVMAEPPRELPAGAAVLLYLTPADDHATWLALAAENGWWVAWDLTGAPAQDFHPAQQVALAPRVLTIDDVEAQLPGWRVGWMVGTTQAAALRSLKQAMTICTTNVSQWAALELLRSHDA